MQKIFLRKEKERERKKERKKETIASLKEY